LSSDGTALTITLADNLPQGAEVAIDIPVEAVQDGGGNFLTANSTQNVGFDVIRTKTNGSSVENVVDELCFNTFSPNGQPTEPFGLEQISPALNGDGGSDTDAMKQLFGTTETLIDTADPDNEAISY